MGKVIGYVGMAIMLIGVAILLMASWGWIPDIPIFIVKASKYGMGIGGGMAVAAMVTSDYL